MKIFRTYGLIPLLLMALSSCTREKSPRVIVLGFDGLDPVIVETLIGQGQMPNLARLREQGAWGRLSSIQPSISAVIWTSIATGTTMIKHGIVSWTYVREKGISVPYNQSEVRQPPVWEILDQWKKRSVVVNWFNTYPPEPIRGVVISDSARRLIQLKKSELLRDTVYPPNYFSLVERFADRDFRRVFQQNDLPNYFKLAQQRGLDIANTTALPGYGLYVLHENLIKNVAWELQASEPWDFFTVYFRFPDEIEHILNAFMPADLVAAAAEQMKKTGKLPAELAERLEKEYAKLAQPVYAWADRILGGYMQSLDKRTYLMVVSDHGFAFAGDGFNHQLPADREPVAGFFALTGPGVRRSFVIPLISVYDVAPTILYLFSLPLGQEMDGKLRPEMFSFSRPCLFRPYFKKSFVKAHRQELDQATLEELRTLGYIR
jgi:predicted AlkP superfamily phosphohydrolase/phosphomutase